jgi:hypothetical protein
MNQRYRYFLSHPSPHPSEDDVFAAIPVVEGILRLLQ